MCVCLQYVIVNYPEKRVECSVLHELCDDHRGPALGDHALQSNDVRLVKLAHDWRLGQEVPPLPLRVANLKGLDGHENFFFPDRLQATFVHLPKLTWRRKKNDGAEIKVYTYQALQKTVCDSAGKTSALLGIIFFLMLLWIQSP